MKKLFIVELVCLVTLLWVYWHQVHVPKTRYLKQETALRHLKQDPQLKKPLAPWMFEQIREDLALSASVSLEAVDLCSFKLRGYYPWIRRYRLVENQLYCYVPENGELPQEDTHTEKAIRTLTHIRRLPDMDFLVSYLDAYPLESVVPEELPAPLLVSGKIRTSYNGILIPDERSIGPWWLGELRMIKKHRIPWVQKEQKAFWRGGFTKELRRELCRISLKYPEYLDARIVAPTNQQEELEQEGLTGQRCNWIDLLGYRYLPLLDGVMCAWPAFQGRLFSQSVTLKPDSEEVQWFYRPLQPYKHYIPVAKDLSDLIEQLDWAKASDEECQTIAANAYQFAKDHLMFVDIMSYLLAVLNSYGEKQQANGQLLKDQVAKEELWVNIQRRK